MRLFRLAYKNLNLVSFSGPRKLEVARGNMLRGYGNVSPLLFFRQLSFVEFFYDTYCVFFDYLGPRFQFERSPR